MTIQPFSLLTCTLWATETDPTEQGLLLPNCWSVTVYTQVNPPQAVCLHPPFCGVLALPKFQPNTHCNTQLQSTTDSTNSPLAKPGAPSSCIFSKVYFRTTTTETKASLFSAWWGEGTRKEGWEKNTWNSVQHVLFFNKNRCIIQCKIDFKNKTLPTINKPFQVQQMIEPQGNLSMSSN